MSQHRQVNVIPNTKIKIKNEPPDEDDYNISCRLCNKCYANEVALRNHVSMEHIEAFCTGDPSVWTVKKAMSTESKTELIKKKTDEIMSKMTESNIMSLASEDVDYIIIKADEATAGAARSRRRRGEKTEAEKAPPAKREKEVVPITGPFECLQPSVLVQDGTCHQIFFSCCEYSVHFRDEHTRRRKGLRCQVCEKPLAGGDNQAPYSCEVCGAGFKANKDLSNHMATDHVKLKPFECNICHKRFTQQGGVQQHMRMHTGDRPFPCTFCPKAFTQKSGLDQHLRIHTKVKPYRCVICSKTFCQSHGPFRPCLETNLYRCFICSKTFCQSVHLRQHMRTHTNVSPFQCGICQKRFKQSSHLNYHLKNHDQGDMTPDQRTVYKKLVMLMNDNEEQSKLVHMSVDKDGNPVEVEIPAQEVQEVLEEGEVQTDDMQEVQEVEVLLDEQEQYLAEQSIKVEHQEEYLLSDVIQDM